jgi:hypothetical protein
VLKQDLLDAASGATFRALRSSASHTGRRLACPQGLEVATWCSTKRKAETEQVESLQCSVVQADAGWPVGHPASARCED